MTARVGRRVTLGLTAILLVFGVVAWFLLAPGSAEPVPPPARVRPDRRPAWTRAPRGVELPPVSESGRRQPVVSFDEGGEDTDEEEGLALVSGWILDDRGGNVAGGRVNVDCGSVRTWREVDDQGWFEISVWAPTSCSVVGTRSDGLLLARSAPVSFDLNPGEDLEFDLVVPAARTGGVGISIAEHEYGIEAVVVHEGTPAWEAGLRAGDVITRVEGRDAVDLSPDDFVAVMTGPEGSNVAFRALVQEEDGGWVEEEFALVRRFLSSEVLR